MLLYVTLGTNDLARGIAFYDPIFAVLGVPRLSGWSRSWAGWGHEADREEGTGFWLCTPFDGRPATAGNGTMVALPAASAAVVRAVHATGLANGGTDEGAPGTRPHYEPTFYVAYLRDPDGNKLSCFHFRYDPSEETGS